MTSDSTPSDVAKKPPIMPYASNAPGSLGTPDPAPREFYDKVVAKAAGIITAGAAGAVFLAILSGNRVTTRGATRSARLQWEQRQQEIDNEISGVCADRCDEANGE